MSTNLLIHVLPPNQRLLQTAVITTNGFQFAFPGQESVQYWVEIATNLTPPMNWQTLQTIFMSLLKSLLRFRTWSASPVLSPAAQFAGA